MKNEELEKGFYAIREYDLAFAQEEERLFQQLDNSLRFISRELDTLSIQHEAHLKATKGRFNLFTVLRGSRQEVGLHSKWLKHLLDPEANHDCGILFLQLFFQVLRKGVQPHGDGAALNMLSQLDDCDCYIAKVTCEERIADGRMDISINCLNWGTLAIENKIDACEQPRQIAKYVEHLRQGRCGKNAILLYLTLDGHQSTTAYEFEGDYWRISYKKHILEWLEECLRSTYNFVNINQSLQQYKNVVYELVWNSQPMAKEYMEKVKDLLRKHPAIIKHLGEIRKGADELLQECWKPLVEQMAEAIKQLEPSRYEPAASMEYCDYPRFFVKRSGGKSAGPAGLDVVVEADVESRKLYVGCFLCQGVDLTTEAAQRVMNAIGESKAVGHNAKWPLGVMYLLQMDENLLFEFLSEELRQTMVEKLARDVVRYISDVTERWKWVTNEINSTLPSR